MFLISKSQNEIVEKILQECSMYLYSGKKNHVTFRKQKGDILRCDNDNHLFETKEIRYGKALIITYFCSTCGSCYGEVFPPRGC